MLCKKAFFECKDADLKYMWIIMVSPGQNCLLRPLKVL